MPTYNMDIYEDFIRNPIESETVFILSSVDDKPHDYRCGYSCPSLNSHILPNKAVPNTLFRGKTTSVPDNFQPGEGITFPYHHDALKN